MGTSVFPPVIFLKIPGYPAPNGARGLGKPGRTRGPAGWKPALSMLCAGAQEEGGAELYENMDTMPPRQSGGIGPFACEKGRRSHGSSEVASNPSCSRSAHMAVLGLANSFRL